jgi:hypothetical protein
MSSGALDHRVARFSPNFADLITPNRLNLVAAPVRVYLELELGFRSVPD